MKVLKTTLTALSSILIALISSSVYADLHLRFIEGAPKDTFIIENTGQCVLNNFIVDIDLSSSAGGLFFDTTAAGAGVEVFQPFEIRSGNFTLANNNITDGNDAISLNVTKLSAGDNISFTIDVDDQLSNSDWGQIRVSGSEINGAQARLKIADQAMISSAFGTDNHTVIETNCNV